MIGLTVAVQMPAVQTKVVHYVTKQLENKLKTKVKIESVNIRFFKKIEIFGMYIEDLQKDTLLFAPKLTANISIFSIQKQKVIISSVELDHARIGLKNLKETNTSNFKFIIDAFASKDTSASNSPWEVKLESASLIENTFSYVDLRYTEVTKCIDFENVFLTHLNIDAKDFQFYKDSTFINIVNISLHEKSGFKIDHLGAEALFADTVMRFRNLEIKTPYSDIKGHYRMEFKSMDDFDDYISKVNMRAEFIESTVSSNDIQYFSSELFGLDKTISISGIARGTVDQLKVKKLKLGLGKTTHFAGNVIMSGLPDIENTYFDIMVDDFVSNKTDIETIPKYPFLEKAKIKLPDNFALLGECKINGKFTGFISDFVAYADVNTALGFISSDINLKTSSTPEVYSGHINSRNFDIGIFTNSAPTIGKISINANVKGQGFRFDNLLSQVNGTVSNFEFNGYNYQNMTVNGEVAKKMFKGALGINDKNLTMQFDGSVDYSKPEPVFDCNAFVENMHPTQLNLFNRDTSTSIDANVSMHFSGDDLDNALGTLQVTGLKFSEFENSFRVDSILLNSYLKEDVKHFDVNSDVLDANISGISRLTTLIKSIEQVVVQYFPVNIPNLTTCEKPENGNFKFLLKDINALLYIFYPELKVANNSIVEGQINTYTNQVGLNVQSEDVILHGVEFKELSINGSSIGKQLGIKLKTGELLLNDSLTINDFIIKGISARDSATIEVNAATLDSSEFVIDLGLKAYFSNEQANFNIAEQTLLIIHNKRWYFNPENRISIGNGTRFENFKMYINENEWLAINGTVGNKNSPNKLDLEFKNFNLDVLKTLFRDYEIELGGITNGTASYGTKNDKPDLTADLTIINFSFYGDTLGDAIVISDFDTEKNRINIDTKITGAAAKNVDIDGYYQIGKGKSDDELHFDCKLKRTSIAAFGHYLNGLVSNLNGMVSADLELRGTPANPTLTGKGNLQKAGFTVDYLNTHYTLTDAFELNERSIDFKNVTLYDAKGNTAKINGKLKHHNLKDFELDFEMLPNNFMVLNTFEWQNDLFYGKAFASGKVTITGPLNNVDMKIALISKKGTEVNLPLSTPEEVNESGFITFIKHDTLKRSVIKNKSELLGMNIDMELSLNNDAEIKLIFDQKIGDIITGQGNGDLRIQVLNDGTFKLFGGYTINKGSYYFTMQNLIGKYFELVKGGTIKWIGDPYDGTIDLQAKYTKNVGLYDLLQDTSGQYKRKVPVEVVLSLKNNLFNPDIYFDIIVPDVDASTATLIQRYINTEEERNKQAMSVIVFNKFATPSVLEGSSTINSGSNVGASLSEFVTQQLSNWASQISSDFNIDFSYTPGDIVTSEQYDVAVSTKLLDDRVKLTGTVGYGNSDQSNSNASSVVGDFLIEVDISKDGRFKLKGFNKSNNNTLLSTTTANYTQGIGWTYRQEFDKFGDLFKRKEKKPIELVNPISNE